MIQVIALLLGSFLVGPLQKTVDVCELLRNIETYNGQIVTVRAFVGGGSRHGYYVTGNKNELPCDSMADARSGWPPTIALAWPENGVPQPDVPFERDLRAQEKLAESIRAVEQRKQPDEIVEATFEGQIRTRPSITIFHDSRENVFAGNGYGQFGMHAAQLIIKTVSNISIQKK